ncbi:unnamed protein product [Prunus brigantina]
MISLDHHHMMSAVEFVDYFPSMIARLGEEGFIGELCNGFVLLMDVEKGLITFESLKRNCVVLGLHDMGDDELVWMLMEGDLDGDGALSQMEFCILMFRLSPDWWVSMCSDAYLCGGGVSPPLWPLWCSLRPLCG